MTEFNKITVPDYSMLLRYKLVRTILSSQLDFVTSTAQIVKKKCRKKQDPTE